MTPPSPPRVTWRRSGAVTRAAPKAGSALPCVSDPAVRPTLSPHCASPAPAATSGSCTETRRVTRVAGPASAGPGDPRRRVRRTTCAATARGVVAAPSPPRATWRQRWPECCDGTVTSPPAKPGSVPPTNQASPSPTPGSRPTPAAHTRPATSGPSATPGPSSPFPTPGRWTRSTAKPAGVTRPSTPFINSSATTPPIAIPRPPAGSFRRSRRPSPASTAMSRRPASTPTAVSERCGRRSRR